MTVLNPKVKKSSHREKSERTRSINPGSHGSNDSTSHSSHHGHSSVSSDLKKSYGTASRSLNDNNKKHVKKVTFEKQAGSSKQCAMKAGCSDFGSSKPSSSYHHHHHHHHSPQHHGNKKEDNGEACNSDDEYGSGFLNDELERRFAQRLYDVRGLQIKEVKGDGACMFRAVADQVFGDEEKHPDVRLNCVEFIARNREHFSQFITEDFDAYLARKRQAEVHGNHVELQAISEIYGRQIEIYEYDTKPVITFHPITVEANAVGEHPPLMLSYHGNVHYNSVIDPFHPVNAPINPLVFPNLSTNMHERVSYKNAVNASELSHIEEQMLSDKLKMTDYEGTEDELTKQVTKESYMDYIRSLERRSSGAKIPKDEHEREREHPKINAKTGELPQPRTSPPLNKGTPHPRTNSTTVKAAASGATKRGAYFSDVLADGLLPGPKIKRSEASVSLPNLTTSHIKPFSHVVLPRSVSSPASIYQEPTSTKALLNNVGDKAEVVVTEQAAQEPVKNDVKTPEKESNPAATVPQNPSSSASLYEELLASTAFDDDDESQSLAQALALSQQEYYSNFR